MYKLNFTKALKLCALIIKQNFFVLSLILRKLKPWIKLLWLEPVNKMNNTFWNSSWKTTIFSHVQSFGCLAFVHDHDLPKDKSRARNRPCNFWDIPMGRKDGVFMTLRHKSLYYLMMQYLMNLFFHLQMVLINLGKIKLLYNLLDWNMTLMKSIMGPIQLKGALPLLVDHLLLMDQPTPPLLICSMIHLLGPFHQAQLRHVLHSWPVY